MIVAPASLSPLRARLQVGIQSSELAGIGEGEASRYRDVLDYKRSRDYMSIVVGVSRAEYLVTRTYLQRIRHRLRRSWGDNENCSRPRGQLEFLRP